MSIHDIQDVTGTDEHLQSLQGYILKGFLPTRNDVIQGMKQYCTFRDKLIITNGKTMKNRRITRPTITQEQVLKQFHINYMDIKKTRMLARELICWSYEYKKENYNIYLEFQQTQPKEQLLPHKVPGKLWQVIGADIFHTEDKNFLCIIDSFSKYPMIR